MSKKTATATPNKAIKAVPVIQSVRLSLIWAEVLPDFLQAKVPADSPFGSFPRNFLFAKTFESARDGASTNPKFDAPWLRERKQKFWMRYLVQGKLSQVKGSQAWNYLVPLRVDTGIKVKATQFKGDVFIDAFYYPFGTAVAISLRWDPNVPLGQLVNEVYSVYKNGRFSTVPGKQKITLEEVADQGFKTLRERALGKNSEADYRTPEPFSILTVIQGTGVDQKAPVRKNQQIMETLEALTSWPANPAKVKLPDLDKACLPTKGHSPESATLYSSLRGRAVWIPALFNVDPTAPKAQAVPQAQFSSKLGCYHRNLFFASLQIESLGRLVCYTSQLFAQGTQKANLRASHRYMVANAGMQLSKLYLGLRDNTWRSASAERQIANNCFTCLQKVLQEFQQEQLPDPPAKPAFPAVPAIKAAG